MSSILTRLIANHPRRRKELNIHTREGITEYRQSRHPEPRINLPLVSKKSDNNSPHHFSVEVRGGHQHRTDSYRPDRCRLSWICILSNDLGRYEHVAQRQALRDR